MQNRFHPVPGFVYEKKQLIETPGHPTSLRIDVHARSRRSRLGHCSGCGHRGRTYDHLDKRRFDFVPFPGVGVGWGGGVAVVLIEAMRRIDCPRCGPTVAWVAPWIPRVEPGSKRRTTLAMRGFVSRWAERLSRQEVAEVFAVSGDTVYRSVHPGGRVPGAGAGAGVGVGGHVIGCVVS